MTWRDWSHQIKNHLTVIRANSQLWHREVKGETKYLDKITAQVDEIVALLNTPPKAE